MSVDTACMFYELCDKFKLKTLPERQALMEILRKESKVVGLTKADIQRQLKRHKKVLKIKCNE